MKFSCITLKFLFLLPASIIALTITPSTIPTASSSALSAPTSASPDPTIADSKITDPPTLDDVTLAIQQKWHLTTYTSCATFPDGYVDCGVHVPVLPGGDEIAGARGLDVRTAGILAGVGALGMALLLR